MNNAPIEGSQFAAAVDEVQTQSGIWVPRALAVTTAYGSPARPRLLIELPDRPLRDLGKVDLGNVTVEDLSNADALHVALVDGSGDQITSFGGGTEFNEDAQHSSGAAGKLVLGVRADSAASLAGTDGDYTAPIFDANGRLWVNASGVTLTVDATGQGDVPVTLDSEAVVLGAGSASIGTLGANSGVDIGDVDVTSLSNTAINGPGEPTIDSYTHIAINLTTAANQVLVSSAANKQIWVYGFGLTVGDADGQTVSFQDEDDTAISGIMEFAQYGGMSVAPSGNFAMPIWKLATDKDLEVDITGGDVDGWLAYAIVSV